MIESGGGGVESADNLCNAQNPGTWDYQQDTCYAIVEFVQLCGLAQISALRHLCLHHHKFCPGEE